MNPGPMTPEQFDSEVVCRAVYAWVKGDSPEPYSPAVASLTCLVLDLLRLERKRSDGVDMHDHVRAFVAEWAAKNHG